MPSLPTEARDGVVGFALVTPRGFVETDWLIPAETEIIIKDLSRDSGRAGELPTGGVPVSPISHSVLLTITNVSGGNDTGWHIIMETFKPTYGGEDAHATIRLTPTPQVKVPQITVEIEGVYTGPNGERQNATTWITARVRPYTNFQVQVMDPVKKAGQFDVVNYEVRVTNFGVYPENFDVRAASDKEDVHVLPPSSMWVLPGETKVDNISVLTPHGKIYELGRSVVINVHVQSERGPMVPRVATLQIRGSYIPLYWAPVLLVGAVAGAISVRKAVERVEVKRLEAGRPRPVELSPRQAVLLAELRRRDPEAYKEKRAQLAAVYAARRARYREEHREQLKRDREEARIARAEFKAARKRQKLEAKEQARQAKLAKGEAARAAKADRLETRRKEKELRKARKLLGKAQKKQGKLDAKAAAKAAKEQAKADKARAKAEKAAAREAKKAAKAARKNPPGDKT